MRSAGVFLSLLLFGLKSMAQQLPLDSLLRLESRYQKEDTVRAKLLTDIARRYYAVDPSKGIIYANKAIQLSEKLQDKKILAGAYSSMGANTLTLADYPVALANYLKSLELNQAIGNQLGIANNYNNSGLVYYSIFDYPKALEYYQKNLSINEKTGNKASVANTLGNIGAIYSVLRDYPKAIEYYERALQLSEKEGNQQNVAGNLSNLGNVYTQQKDFARALEYKQRALQLYEKLGNQSGVATNLGNIGNVYRQMEDILPEEVAEELKVQGQTMARHFESVTVLFTDFVNFTQKSEELGPQELVNTLHRHFRVFDDIMEKFGLEKIKTIGDAYMAVSGLPVPCADHAQRAAKAALEIRDYIQRNLENDPSDFQIRIGMHSGPVVAGIVGVKKFAYDVWGDTVNTAARMEHGSEPGKINVSGITCGLLGDTFVFESRGTIEAKHKGALEMFFLLK